MSRVNGDTVMMLVSMIMSKRDLPYEPRYIPYVLERLPPEMKGDDRVAEFVRRILNG